MPRQLLSTSTPRLYRNSSEHPREHAHEHPRELFPTVYGWTAAKFLEFIAAARKMCHL
jgi:hypothetical protein